MEATTQNSGQVTCLGQINAGAWCQETYETVSRGAGRRARQLRVAGYRVTVGPLCPQVTPLGTIRMTQVDIRPGTHRHTYDLPAVHTVRLDRY